MSPNIRWRSAIAIAIAVALPLAQIALGVFAPSQHGQVVPALLSVASFVGIAGLFLVQSRERTLLFRAIDQGRKEADWYRLIVESAGEAIIIIDDHATIRLINRAAERMFGYPAGELINTSLERLMTERARRSHAAYLARTGVTEMVEAARMRTEHKGVRRSGEVFSFELTMRELLTSEGRMFSGVIRDVSAHEMVRNDLLEAKTKLKALYEDSDRPQVLLRLADSGQIYLESVNRAADLAFKAMPQGLRGASLDEFCDFEAPDLKRTVLECLSVGRPLSRPSKIRGFQAVHVTPLRGADEVIKLVLVTACPSAANDGTDIMGQRTVSSDAPSRLLPDQASPETAILAETVA